MNLNTFCGQRPAFPKGLPEDKRPCSFAAGHKGDHSWVPLVRAQACMARFPTEAESEMWHQQNEARKLK